MYLVIGKVEKLANIESSTLFYGEIEEQKEHKNGEDSSEHSMGMLVVYTLVAQRNENAFLLIKKITTFVPSLKNCCFLDQILLNQKWADSILLVFGTHHERITRSQNVHQIYSGIE